MPTKRDPNFGFLLVGILAFLIFGPILDRFVGGDADGIVLMIGYTAMLVIGIFSLQENRAMFATGLVLAVTCVGITIFDSLTTSVELDLLSMTLLLIFQIMSIYLALEFLVSGGKTTFNKIIGGACVYFLLGMTWTILYMYMIVFDPNAITGIDLEGGGSIYWDLTYFSFVTITTLGYGDILPVEPLAKALAGLESVVGTIYIAILIGALVGTYISERARTPGD